MLDLASSETGSRKLLTACKFNCTRCIKHQREYTKHYISKIYNVVFFEIWLHRAAAGNETAVDNWPFLQIPTGLWQLSVMGSVWLSPPSLRAAWFLSVRCDGLGSPNFSVQTGTLRFWSRTKAFQGREKRKASALYQLHRLKPAYVDRIYHSATELPMQLQAPKRHLRVKYPPSKTGTTKIKMLITTTAIYNVDARFQLHRTTKPTRKRKYF